MTDKPTPADLVRATLDAKSGHPTPDATARPTQAADTAESIAALQDALGYAPQSAAEGDDNESGD